MFYTLCGVADFRVREVDPYLSFHAANREQRDVVEK